MENAVKKINRLLIVISAMCVLVAATAQAADFSEGSANVRVKFSDKFIYSNADLMMPLFESPENAAFFINPVIGFDFKLKNSSRDAERFSFGLGQRLYLPGDQFDAAATGGLFEKGIIIGWNSYFDLQYSMYDNFMNKAGLGAEMLSDWVDARVNAYIRLTDDKNLGKSVRRYNYYGTALYRDGFGRDHEILRSGLDGEVGVRLPVPDQVGEMRVFGGGYYFDTSHVSSISGITARFEWNPIPFLALGAEWTDSRKLNGEKWNAQLGFHLPFSANALTTGYSPINVDFTPKTGNLWHDRYTSSVRRNNF